jgi:outer membrane protein assembly factor BamB
MLDRPSFRSPRQESGMSAVLPNPSQVADHSTSPAAYTAPTKPPRLWPAQILVALYWIGILIVTIFFKATFTQFLVQFYTPMLLALGVVVWWLCLSRLPLAARFFGVAAFFAGGLVAYGFADKSMFAHKFFPMGLIMSALPLATTAVVLWLLVSRGATTRLSWLGLLAVSLLGWGYSDLVRVDGITGDLQAARSWRWNPTAEDKFLEERSKVVHSENAKPAAPAEPVELVASVGDWPEFRGALRDGCVRGVQIDADWTAHPPREAWRRRVGPGWSSFAVVGDYVFTQEQRGEVEAVLCLNLATGEEIWSHEDQARFWEVVAGAGPRATPTFHAGKLYTFGGSGRLNCLDAASGRLIWSRDVAVDADVKPPQWGFSSSPLVAQDVVTVFIGGPKESKKEKGIVAFDAAMGEKKWSGGQGTHSYSSPQLLRSAGEEQVLMVSDYGLEAFAPGSGKLLWEHQWYLQGIFRVCQPHVIGDSQILVGTGMGNGTRLLTIAKTGDKWQITENWTSKDLKPYFNDFVSRDGYLYGFDGEILVCVDLATGKKQWKKGRYGHGQALLIGDQGLLVITSEETGEVILAEATPKDLVERGKIHALTGKTWNHPVIAGGKLLVRNGEEMACFDLGQTIAVAAVIP